jgi:hypothetical protein
MLSFTIDHIESLTSGSLSHGSSSLSSSGSDLLSSLIYKLWLRLMKLFYISSIASKNMSSSISIMDSFTGINLGLIRYGCKSPESPNWASSLPPLYVVVNYEISELVNSKSCVTSD